MRLIIATCLAAALAVSTIVTAQSNSACNRACLTGFADTYLTALAADTPSAVPLAANAKITSNGRVVRLGDAFWDAADRIVYRFDIVNDRLGDVATEAVVQNSDGSKTMYMVRLKVAGGRITEVETIKANKGGGRSAVGSRHPHGRVAGIAAVAALRRSGFVLRADRRR